jgi:hemoglobin-like flavoprotein
VTPDQITLVKESFALVVPIADTAAELLYNRLFELDPSLRSLFHGDAGEQRRKLMKAVTVVVQGLDRLEPIMPAILALGRRHAEYGVRPRDIDLGGEALLWSLDQGLGSAFTAEVRDAWAAAYALLGQALKTGMEEASLPAAA